MLDQFDSVTHALRFAFNIRARVICKTSSFFPQFHGADTRHELSPYELKAQASMILNSVDRLPAVEQLLVYGMYDPELRGQAAEMVAYELSWEPAKVGFVRAWLGGNCSIRAVAKQLDISFTAARNLRLGVFDELDRQYKKAMASLEMSLKDLIRSAA